MVGPRQSWGLEGQEEGRTIPGDSLSMGALGLALNWGQLCPPGDTWGHSMTFLVVSMGRGYQGTWQADLLNIVHQ